MHIDKKHYKWIIAFAVIIIALVINSVLVVQMYQRQEVWQTARTEEINKRNLQWESDYIALTNEYLEIISGLQSQLTEQGKTLAETADRVEWLSEENELLKKKLQ